MKSSRVMLFWGSIVAGVAGLTATPIQAHFLFFEAPTTVEQNKEMSSKLFYGEYHENQYESRQTRLGERKRARIRLVTPSGQVNELDKTMKERHYSAQMAVDEPGMYDLLAVDDDSPVVDYSDYGIGVVKPNYYSRTRFMRYAEKGVSRRARDPEPRMTLDIVPVTEHLDYRDGAYGPEVGDEVLYQVFFKDEPLTKNAETVRVYAPNGWMWEGKPDEEGIGRFKPLWPGLYVVEVIFREEAPGSFNDNDYEAIRHRAALSVHVGE